MLVNKIIWGLKLFIILIYMTMFKSSIFLLINREEFLAAALMMIIDSFSTCVFISIYNLKDELINEYY